MRTLFMYHSRADSIWLCDSIMHPIIYCRVGAEGGVLSFGPCGFRERFSHRSFENHKLFSIVSGESNTNVPVVMLAKPPGFSSVGSFTLTLKSRLSYAMAQSPFVERSWMIHQWSFVSA